MPAIRSAAIVLVVLSCALVITWLLSRRRARAVAERRTGLLVEILGDAATLTGDRAAADAVVRRLATALSADAAALGMVRGDLLVMLGMHGYERGLRDHRLQYGEGCSGRAWSQNRALVVTDVADDGSYIAGSTTVRSGVYVPGRVDGRVVLVLAVESVRVSRWGGDDVLLMQPLADLLAQMLESRRVLREAGHLERELLTLVSHEMRTPLTTILGSLTTVDSRWGQLDEPSRRELVAAGRRGGERLEHLVESVILAARLEADDVVFRLSEVPVRALLDEAARQSAVSAQVVVDCSPDVAVVADNAHLLAAVQALVDNALVHGGGRAELSSTSLGKNVSITVRDHGAGIPPALRDDVFGRFRRGPDALARGVGLGLYVARRLVEGMGGRLTVDDEVAGCAMVITLTGSVGAQVPQPREVAFDDLQPVLRLVSGD